MMEGQWGECKPSFRVTPKLKAMKVEIKKWNKEERHRESTNMQLLFQEIATIDGRKLKMLCLSWN